MAYWGLRTIYAEFPVFCMACGGPTTEQNIDNRLRPVCSVCGTVAYLDPKLAATVVSERDGELLIGLRAAHTREPGKWSFPAGFVDRGEVVEAAAIREVAEETGLDVSVSEVLDLISAPGDPVVLAVYAATSVSGTPHPGDDLDELAWFAPEAMPELAFAHDRDIIAAWQRWRAARAIS
jgi:8-oxo-dGTP pyrophosphatase MutT (NUDIX family)